MSHYDCTCCGERLGVSHDNCPACKAGRCPRAKVLTIDAESPPGSWVEAIKTLPSQVVPIVPTDKWWAQRWIDKATPGELAAMRELLKC